MKISILVPFRANRSSPHRARVWKWLYKYYRHELPDAEIVIGHSCSPVFSKSEAVNDAASKASGDIFVILDSDAFIEGSTILRAAAAIQEGRSHGHNIWFMPYRHLYRLTETATERVLQSDPKHPYRFPSPPDKIDVESTVGTEVGHYFGAMCQILPREAFETVGCWDERFVGWGAEDISFLLATDTLWGKHKSLDAEVFHLWHPAFRVDSLTKMWEGQDRPTHSHLGNRYRQANGDYQRMRNLVDEGCGVSKDCQCNPDDDFFWWIIVLLIFMFLLLMC